MLTSTAQFSSWVCEAGEFLAHCLLSAVQKTLTQLLDAAEKEKKRAEMSADEPGVRTKLRQEIYDEMPGEDLRPHAFKMELRPHEHEALELVSHHCPHHRSASGLGLSHDSNYTRQEWQHLNGTAHLRAHGSSVSDSSALNSSRLMTHDSLSVEEEHVTVH